MNDARHRFQPATATALITIHHRIIAELTWISHSTHCIERQNVYQLSRQTSSLKPSVANLLQYFCSIIFYKYSLYLRWEVEGKSGLSGLLLGWANANRRMVWSKENLTYTEAIILSIVFTLLKYHPDSSLPENLWDSGQPSLAGLAQIYRNILNIEMKQFVE